MQRITGVDSKIRLISTIVDSGVLCANSCNCVLSQNASTNIKYLLGILNSKAINFYFKQTSTNTNVTKGDLFDLPIPSLSSAQQQPIIDAVNKILEAKKQDTQVNTEVIDKCEREIDMRVYKLYDLTLEEAQIIDANVTAEEFEKY